MPGGEANEASNTNAWALVCACASPRLTPRQEVRIASLCAAPIDWTAVAALAERHRVTPLVAARLRSLCAAAVPADILAGLTHRLRHITARNVHLATHLCSALDRLDEAGIDVCAFKGASLAVAAYGGVGWRPFDDLDLLVTRERIARAADALRGAGYRPALAFDEAHEAALIAQARPRALVHEAARVTIDLHWAFTPRYFMSRLHADHLRGERTTVLVRGRAVPTLAPEALLPVLSVHGHKHCWSRLIWIADIAALVTASEALDWDRVAAHAHAWQCERMLGLALTLAADLLETPVPEAARRGWIADPAVRRLAARVSTRLLADARAWSANSTGGAAMLDGVDKARFHLAAMGSWRDRVRYVRFSAEPSEADWHGSRLPAVASFLHYPLRALRVLAPALRPKRP